MDRSGRKIIDPNDPSRRPYFGKPDTVSDMFGPGMIYEAMIRALDGKTHQVHGVAFRLHVKGHRKKRLGFAFRVYCGADTVGWETEDEYTVVNAYLDIMPMRLVGYPPYKMLKKRTRKTKARRKAFWPYGRPLVLNAHAGTRHGIPFPVYYRAAFGVRGANVPALLRALVACGWFGIRARDTNSTDATQR